MKRVHRRTGFAYALEPAAHFPSVRPSTVGQQAADGTEKATQQCWMASGVICYHATLPQRDFDD